MAVHFENVRELVLLNASSCIIDFGDNLVGIQETLVDMDGDLALITELDGILHQNVKDYPVAESF